MRIASRVILRQAQRLVARLLESGVAIATSVVLWNFGIFGDTIRLDLCGRFWPELQCLDHGPPRTMRATIHVTFLII